MSRVYPGNLVIETPAQKAVVDGVVGSFGDRCLLVQMSDTPSVFVFLSENEQPILLCCHDGLEYDPQGWQLSGEDYDIDIAASDAVASLQMDARLLGQDSLDPLVIHVVNSLAGRAADEPSLGDVMTGSAWPVVIADPMLVAQAIESEGRSDSTELTRPVIESLARIVGGDDIRATEEDAPPAERSVEEIVVTTTRQGAQVTLDRIFRAPNVMGERLSAVLLSAIEGVGINSFSCRSDSIEPEHLISPDGLLPAVLVSAAQRWSLLLHARPNVPGFFIRLKTDPLSALGFRVEAVHTHSPASLILSILQVLTPLTDETGDCSADTLIDAYGIWADSNGLHPPVSGGEESEEVA